MANITNHKPQDYCYLLSTQLKAQSSPFESFPSATMFGSRVCRNRPCFGSSRGFHFLRGGHRISWKLNKRAETYFIVGLQMPFPAITPRISPCRRLVRHCRRPDKCNVTVAVDVTIRDRAHSRYVGDSHKPSGHCIRLRSLGGGGGRGICNIFSSIRSLIHFIFL